MRDFREAIRRRVQAADLVPHREAEIVEEIAIHLDERYTEQVERGVDPDEAAAIALAELEEGDVLARHLSRTEARAKEPLVAGAPRRGLLVDLVRDLRFGARALRRSPVFTAVTLLSLALGIGANTAIFQLLDAIHLRKLPVAAPDELAIVRIQDRDWAKGSFRSWHPDLSYPLFEEIRANQKAFSSMAAWGDLTLNLAPRGQAIWARAHLVSGDFFRVLGVKPLHGRLLTADDDVPGCASPSVVVSHGFWRKNLGGDPSALGHKLTLDGHTVTVAGVTGPEFFGPEVGRTFDVIAPICMLPVLRPHSESWLELRHTWWLSAIARLEPGWTHEKASAHLAAISPALMEETVPPAKVYTADDARRYRSYRLGADPASHGISRLRDAYTTPLYFLLATAALVLLIACANLANLMLARATAREREIAVRLAIGASRARLVRQLMTESLLLAALGAALAVVLASLLSDFLVSFLSTRQEALSMKLDPDLRVLGFTAGLAGLTCLLFGLAPALHAARTDVGMVLKTHALSAGGGRLRMRRALVAVQVALSFVLLVGALLFARSFSNVVSVDTGFRPEGLMVLEIDFAPLDPPDDQLEPLQRQLLDRVRNAPAVDGAAAVGIVPVSGDSWDDLVSLEGAEPRTIIDAFFNRVSPGYFETLGASILAGRDFHASDRTGAPEVAIVGQTMARMLGGAEDLVGRRIRIAGPTADQDKVYEIVGLVSDTKYGRLRERMRQPGPDGNFGEAKAVEFRPLVFLPASQDPEPAPYATMMIRFSAPVADVVASVKRAVAEAAPAAILDHRLLEDSIGETLVRERLLATLSGFFGLLAALLAAIGLYGVIAYSVARRTHEIGVRMALGADRRRIAAMFLGEALRLLAIGLGAGAVLALIATRWAESLLYGLAPHDPLTLVLAALLMAAITCVASVLPAWRAATVDPMVALREE